MKCAEGKAPVARLALQKQSCARTPAGRVIRSSADAVSLTAELYGCLPQEYVVALALDAQNGLISILEVHRGGLDTSMVDPKALFSMILLSGATGFILVHNHPSGSVAASSADDRLTEQVSLGARQLTLRFMDHIIVSGGSTYYSYVEKKGKV